MSIPISSYRSSRVCGVFCIHNYPIDRSIAMAYRLARRSPYPDLFPPTPLFSPPHKQLLRSRPASPSFQKQQKQKANTPTHQPTKPATFKNFFTHAAFLSRRYMLNKSPLLPAPFPK
jgi:hypothetical protein